MKTFTKDAAPACPARAVLYTLLRHGRSLDVAEAGHQLEKRLDRLCIPGLNAGMHGTHGNERDDGI